MGVMVIFCIGLATLGPFCLTQIILKVQVLNISPSNGEGRSAVKLAKNTFRVREIVSAVVKCPFFLMCNRFSTTPDLPIEIGTGSPFPPSQGYCKEGSCARAVANRTMRKKTGVCWVCGLARPELVEGCGHLFYPPFFM